MATPNRTPSKFLGFDLGDGESALAECTAESSGEPDVLKVVDNRQSFLTCIGRDRAGRVLLGQAALDASGAEHVFLTFKRRPGDRANSSRAIASEFFGEVLSRAERAGCDLQQSAIVVGHPSAWTPPEVEEYTAALAGSTGWQVRGISESRAAFLQLKETGKLTVAQLKSTALIVDIGSSTTDMTIIRHLTQQPLDIGHNALGGRLIDRSILAYVLAQHPDGARLGGIIRSHPHIYAQCEYLCRLSKEAFFTNEEALRASGEAAPNKQFVEIDEHAIFRVKLDAKGLDAAMQSPMPDLGGQSWAATFRATLQDVAGQCRLHGDLPRTVAMTGGGARMGFTRQICREVFPEAELILDTSPEFTIAKGLARAGRWDARAAAFLEELDPLCAKLPEAFRKESSRFIEDVVPPLADDFVSAVVMRGLIDWRKGTVTTLNGLEGHLKQLGAAWANTPGVRGIIETATRHWSERAMLHIAPAIQGLTHKYGLPYEALNPTIDTVTPEGIAIDVKDVRNDTSSGIGMVAGGIAGIIALKIALVVTPVILAVLLKATFITAAVTGPIGWVIGIVIVGAAFFFGKEAAEEKVKSIALPIWLRSKLLGDEKIGSACAKSRSDVVTALRAEMSKASETELTAKASDVVREELSRKMKDAVVLIGR